MATRRQAVSDILETLSNNEIRQRLILYGYPNISVTNRNRDVLLETLRLYIDAAQRQNTTGQPGPQEAKSASQTAPNSSNLHPQNATVTQISQDLDPASGSEAPPVNTAIAGSILIGGAAALLLGLVYFHSLAGK
uniref:LEM domain-containing protein n=1 Tax=Anopheles atroparvus TaxID=41427 RepID=A0A182JKE1_ANOAO